MKKILCFDGWTQASFHYERHVDEFIKSGFEMILVHYGSWGHDKNRPEEERIGKLIVRDISYYSNSLLNVLRVENPTLVIFLSTRSFINLAFNRYALFLGIPTCLVYHGLVSVQDTTVGDTNPYKFSRSNYARMIMQRVGKNVLINIPKYAFALVYTSAKWSVWKEFFSLVIERITGNWTQKYFIDSKTTFGCVFSNIDIPHMANLYGIPNSKIYVIGNPDLLKFKFVSEHVLSFILRKEEINNQVIYIETAFNNHGLIYSNNADFLKNMINLRDYLRINGIKFKLKLHPANLNDADLVSLLEANQVELVSDNDFINELKKSLGAIVEPSSAIIAPCILGLPIYLNNIGKMRIIPFGKMIYSYPGAHILKEMADLDTINKIKDFVSIDKYEEWITLYIGKVPPDDISENLLRAIKLNHSKITLEV
jgi:hypothetical protein